MADVHDITVGFVIPPRSVARVSEEKMKTMAALLRDPNPIHFDPTAGAALGLGERVVNQGPINVGYVMNMLIAWAGDPAAVERVSVRFDGRVYGGDSLTAGGTVAGIRTQDGGDLATCDVWLRRGDDVVLHGSADVRLPAAAVGIPS